LSQTQSLKRYRVAISTHLTNTKVTCELLLRKIQVSAQDFYV